MNREGRVTGLEQVQDPPLVCVVGFSGTGKTTLIEKLIPVLKTHGLRVGCIKHDAHGFEMDRPGKDSWRHKQAGASATLVSSPGRIGMVMDVEYDHDPGELKKFLDRVDIILAEGYKRCNHPKLEVFRKDLRDEPVCKEDDHLLAVISHTPVKWGGACFSPDDTDGLARFLIKTFHLASGNAPSGERIQAPQAVGNHTHTV
ncbi:MAG: molybdopterin-guanine dinucleotide biosynthesis protein B [Desulfobacteraceae bacterium]